MKRELRVELQEIVADKAPRSLGEAVEKVPTFDGDSDVTLSAEKIEKLVAKHYKVVQGSLKFESDIKNIASKDRAMSFVNFFAENAEDADDYISGSVIISIELRKTVVRVYSLINIDG